MRKSPLKDAQCSATKHHNTSGNLDASANSGSLRRSILKDTSGPRVSSFMKAIPIPMTPSKEQRIVTMADDNKSLSHATSKKKENPFADKTIEEIEVEMERARDRIDRNNTLIAKLRSNTLRSTKDKEKEVIPLRDEVRDLTQLVKQLDKLIDEKTPFWEKLPKDTVFYKHLMSNMYTAKIDSTTKETATIEKCNLFEAAEDI